MGTHGALFFEPYDDQPDNYGHWRRHTSDDSEYKTRNMEKMYKLIKEGLEAGFIPNVHAIGTRGVAEMLDLYERLMKEGIDLKGFRVIHVKALELALNDGKCRLCGRQMGPKTGDPRSFTSIDDVLQAFKTQLEFATWHGSIALNTEVMVHAKVMPVPFLSSTLQGCVERGTDMTAGGTDYYWTSLIAIAGMSNVGDSLAAIKKLVFEEKRVSMDELLNALDANFEGHEPLRQMLINRTPKFGNDIDYVDELTVNAVDMAYEESQTYKDPRGGELKSSI